MTPSKTNVSKRSVLIISWIFAALFRLLPLRAFGIDPLLSLQLPLTSHMGAITGFAFSASQIALFDLYTGQYGIHTLFVAITYGSLSMIALQCLGREYSLRRTVVTTILCTLIFDALTGLCMGPVLYGQPFMHALIGQVPFTAKHLAGNLFGVLTLSTLLNHILTRISTHPLYQRFFATI